MSELYHWGYIKRWKENGEWKYLYPDDVGGKKYSNPTGVAQNNRKAFGSKRGNSMNQEQRQLMRSGSASGLKVYKDAVKDKPETSSVERPSSGTQGYSSQSESRSSATVEKKLERARKYLSAKELQQLRITELERRVATGIGITNTYGNLLLVKK